MIKFLRFVPVQFTFFLLIGILFGNFNDYKSIQLISVLIILLVFLTVFYSLSNKYVKFSSFVFTFFVFTTVFFIGIATITFNKEVNQNKHYTNVLKFSEKTSVEIILKIRKELKPSLNYEKYEAIVIQVNNKNTLGKILLNVKKDTTSNLWDVDDEILLKTRFLDIQQSQNPYGFNYKNYLKNQQIHHQVYAGNGELFKIQEPKSTIYGIATNIRSHINNSLLKNGFKNDELALINALLLGQRQTISEDLLEDYKDAGAIHILAVSGLHIGIILLLLVFLFKPLHSFKNGKLIATILIVSILWFYAIIAGLSASVVRAVAMFSAVSIGMHLNKPSNIYNTLFISMFFLLLFHPFYVFEIGFQLSYMAVFSIVWIQPKLQDLWISKLWFFRKMWQLFTVSIAAQLGILPLSLFYFHQFPGLFFVANMVIIPFLGFILIGGIVVIILSVSNLLPQFLGDFYEIILRLMNGIITWVSSIDAFIIRNISVSFVLMIASYFVIIFLLKWLEKKYYSRLLLVFVSLLFFQSILIFEKYQRQSKNEFIVFNSSRKSSIGLRYGDNISFNSPQLNSISKAYVIGANLKSIDTFKQQAKLFNFKNETILVVDSLSFYNYKSIKPTIILLQHSPKINLERLIQNLKPKLIVADATNYKNVISKWEQTSIKKKTPFYNTMQKGAFILKD